MSHANKLHILYLIVMFYSWLLSSLSKCLHLKQRVPFPEQHSTSISLNFQLNETSAHRDKKAKTIWADTRDWTAASRTWKLSWSWCIALHKKEHPWKHTCVCLGHRGGEVITSDSSITATDTKKFSLCIGSTGVICVSLIKLSTLKHVEERVGIITTFI